MYKVIKIQNYAATRDVKIQNLDTGTIDLCFDDSAAVDMKYANFDFIEEGKIYDCKIELFGDFDRTKTEKSVEVAIIDSDVVVGKTKYFKILIGSDVYYILMSDANGFVLNKRMYYHFTRKDLIQVDDVIHADCL